MAESKEALFRRLTRLFRSGPVVKRQVKDFRSPGASSATDLFRKSQSHVYSNAINSYGQYDRMSRYADFSEMEYCVHADTLIAVPDGYKTIKELADEYGLDKEFVVYAYDHNKKQIVPAMGKQARQTRIDHAFKVTFDSGKEIIGTGNHRLMKRDGTFCRIDELKTGDSMMPFYRRDFFNMKEAAKDTGDGYRWIYTMDYENSTRKNGWVSEHRLIAEWVAGRKVKSTEHVHHKNFKKYDNRPENLQIMDAKEHLAYHAKIINGRKWDKELNGDWIEKFKIEHSKFMSLNNPAERMDITFGRILETCENVGFNLYRVCNAFDTDPNVIKRKLRKHGFNDFVTFAKAYSPGWKSESWDNAGEKNPRYDSSLTYQMICDAYDGKMTGGKLASKLDTTYMKLKNRLKQNGFDTFADFKQGFNNHKVVSVEYYGEIPLYDLTVDGYKNFATDSVISHNTPEISSALDIYSDEAVANDERGKQVHIYSDNENIRQLLEELFYDTLNIDFNLRPWVRNLCKYGDFFLFNDVSPQHGVLNAFPIPVNEIEREEGYDPEDPLAVRFRWVTQGNQILENWQVTHMRLQGNDAFLPYGSSIVEPARRIWRQLVLIEDAMLVYRIIRSPERRVFYIDVGNVPPEEIPNYVEQARTRLRSNQVVDRESGRVDLRYNPLSVDEDYFIPVRGSETGTRVDTLAGGVNVSAIEDVEYIQRKLFAALKVPKAYLGYDETLSSKATLAQEDIRFSRTIAAIQKVVLTEMNKIAIIHLFSNGYEGEDLLDFDLQLSNPSTIAQQQKLELFRTRFEILGSVPENMIDRHWLRKNVLELTDDEIESMDERLKDDARMMLELQEVTAGGEAAGPTGGVGGGPALGGPLPAIGEPGEEEAEEHPGEPEEDAEELEPEAGLTAGEEPEEDEDDEIERPKRGKKRLLTGSDKPTKLGTGARMKLSMKDDEAPIRAQQQLKRALYNRSRVKHNSRAKTHMPDFNATLSVKDDTFNDPYGKDFFKRARHEAYDPINEVPDDIDPRGVEGTRARIDEGMKSILAGLRNAMPPKPIIIEEGDEIPEIEDIVIDDNED